MNIGNCMSKKYYWCKPSMFKLLQLLSTGNTTELSNFGKCLQIAETLRNLIVIDKKIIL